MTRDEELIEFWKERYNNDEENGCEELEIQNGGIAYQISRLISEYNTNADSIARIKWHYWWQIILTKRVLKKFKIKCIYRSKKAREFYKKLLWKNCKVKGSRLKDVHKEEVLNYIYAMASNDTLDKLPIYKYIIERMKK